MERVQYGRYRVERTSRPGTVHAVSVDAVGRYRCDCEAGVAERVCRRQAAVSIAKVEHTGGAPVTAPAPAPRSVEVVAFTRRAA